MKIPKRFLRGLYLEHQVNLVLQTRIRLGIPTINIVPSTLQVGSLIASSVEQLSLGATWVRGPGPVIILSVVLPLLYYCYRYYCFFIVIIISITILIMIINTINIFLITIVLSLSLVVLLFVLLVGCRENHESWSTFP